MYSRDSNAFYAVQRSTGCIDRVEIFFAFVEVLLIAAGIYLIQCRDKLFGYKDREGDTYASANLRLAMLVIIWIHAVIMNTIMILRFDQNPQWIPYRSAESW